MGIFLLIALIPQDFERRIRVRGRLPAFATCSASSWTCDARHGHADARTSATRSRGALAVSGAVGFGNIGVLWASFEAFGGDVPFGVLVQGFFVGLAANLIPSPAGGVGSVDAGMIFAFDVLFGLPSAVVFPPCCATA